MSTNLELDMVKAHDRSAPLTLVSTDVRTICKSFEAIHEVWANPIEIGIAIWLLQRQLGLGSIGPALTIIACTIGMAKLAKLMPQASKIWNEEIQKRITVTSEVLGSIKETKLLGMVEFLQRAIQDLRISELGRAKQYRALITYMNILGNASPMIGPVITFSLAVLAQKIHAGLSLSIATVFTSLSIMSLIAGPLAQLIASVPNLLASLGSFERIQIFLEQGRPTLVSKLDSPQEPNNTDRGRTEADQSLEMHIMPSNPSLGQTEIAVIQDGSFTLKAGGEPILRGINLRIISATVTIVIGRVGCGKTTLLRGLLGELPTTGSVKTLRGAVAYCAQTTWLTTGTVKENIQGQSPLDEEWYERVVHACALAPDFAQLPNGDNMLVGSKGQSLSGGQKQRVALARAVYSKSPVLVVDDALSGLDAPTQNHIWNGIFGSDGLVRRYGATVILTTHSLNYLKFADKIVILGDDGRIVSQGNFNAIRKSTYLESLSIEETQSSEADGSETVAFSKSRQQKQSQNKAAETETEQDLLRKTGDTTLYWYYLKSIGWLYSLGEIWLKFWTEEDARTGSADTAYYLGIYAAISIAGLLVIGINIWFVAEKDAHATINDANIKFQDHVWYNSTKVFSKLALDTSSIYYEVGYNLPTFQGQFPHRFTEHLYLSSAQQIQAT
ncbi:ABC multudrug transporter [Colletotrichum tofieldiae]|nr:ABC multudrug transporter [Colletotrichum tofieldiae]